MSKSASLGFFLLSTLIVVAVVGASLTIADPSAVDVYEQELAQAVKTYAGLNTYIGEFVAVETHNGKIKGTETITAVFQKNPRKQYFRWLDGGLYAGLQASYVPARDGQNNLQALEAGVAGLAGVQTLDMTSKVIDKLYPHHFRINQYHVGFILQHIRETYEKGKAAGKVSVQQGQVDKTKIPGSALTMYTAVFAEGAGVPYGWCLLGFDVANHLPRYVEIYDRQNRRYAVYILRKLQINAAIDPNMFTLKKLN